MNVVRDQAYVDRAKWHKGYFEDMIKYHEREIEELRRAIKKAQQDIKRGRPRRKVEAA